MARRFPLAFAARVVAAAAAAYPAAFDAASIKPAAGPIAGEGANRSRIEHTPDSLTMWNVALSDCVQWAYGLASFQVSGANLNNESFDILARTAAPVQVSPWLLVTAPVPVLTG